MHPCEGFAEKMVEEMKGAEERVVKVVGGTKVPRRVRTTCALFVTRDCKACLF